MLETVKEELKQDRESTGLKGQLLKRGCNDISVNGYWIVEWWCELCDSREIKAINCVTGPSRARDDGPDLLLSMLT